MEINKQYTAFVAYIETMEQIEARSTSKSFYSTSA